MDIYKLENLLSKYENEKLDFKAQLNIETDGDKKELAKDVIAIANSKGGRGYIIFGVEDKTKRILGIEPQSHAEEKIQQLLCNRVEPPISVGLDFLDYKGKIVGVLSIFRSHQKPHQMIQTGAFYIRRGSTTDTARREEIASMLQLNGIYSYEKTIVRKATLEDLDWDLLKKYMHVLGVTSENLNEIILEAFGFIDRDEESAKRKPTVGGMLIFGKNPSKFLPHIYIKIINNGESKYFYGNVFALLENTEEYLKTILEKNYPFKALVESIVNAIVHRDYTDITRGITLEINDHEIIISNPGALLEGNLIYTIEKDKNSRKRNPWLYDKLMNLDENGYFPKDGMGITKIKDKFENAKFINIGRQNLFKVVLPRIVG